MQHMPKLAPMPDWEVEHLSQKRSPEQWLLIAVLCRAIWDVLSPQRVDRHHRRDALGWLQSPDTKNPLSFLRICENLGLNPRCLLKKIEAQAAITRDLPLVRCRR